MDLVKGKLYAFSTGTSEVVGEYSHRNEEDYLWFNKCFVFSGDTWREQSKGSTRNGHGFREVTKEEADRVRKLVRALNPRP